MINRLLALALAASTALVATAAGAQEQAPVEPAAAPTEAPAAAAAMPFSADFDVTRDPENILFLDLSTGKRVTIRLIPQWAPKHIERIKQLTRSGFYDGVIFHRVIDGFMAQTGDPSGTGRGGSDLPDLEEEFNMFPHVRGTVAMARAQEENSANSQFFIMFYPRFSLDRRYTNFGRVIAGMDAADEIARGEPPSNPTRILQASIASDNKPQRLPEPVAPAPAPAIQPLPTPVAPNAATPN